MLMLLCSCAHAQKINVVSVTDGDTVKVRFSENIAPIRLVGIDCYETSPIKRAHKQATEYNIPIEEVVKRGQTAKIMLEKLVYDNADNIRFRCDGVDKYGRILGTLYTDKLNINEKMLTSGYCPAYVYRK